MGRVILIFEHYRNQNVQLRQTTGTILVAFQGNRDGKETGIEDAPEPNDAQVVDCGREYLANANRARREH
jgi:hypothetical protein